MKKLTKKQRDILAKLDPRCEECEHYQEGLCHFMAPFLAETATQRLKPAGGVSMNCGTQGRNFKPKE